MSTGAFAKWDQDRVRGPGQGQRTSCGETPEPRWSQKTAEKLETKEQMVQGYQTVNPKCRLCRY